MLVGTFAGVARHIGERLLYRADTFLLAAHLVARRLRIVGIKAPVAERMNPVLGEVGDDLFGEVVAWYRKPKVEALGHKRHRNLLAPLSGLAGTGIGEDAGYRRRWDVGVKVEGHYAAIRVVAV